MSYKPSPGFLVLLVAFAAAGSAATHIFLPALSLVRAEFQVDGGAMQLSIALPMLTLAIMPLIYGPLADGIGRRPVLRFGALVFVGGCLLCIFADNLVILIIGRVLQAGGAAAGLALSRTMAQDIYGKKDTARVLSYLMMAVVVIPMLAPIIGGLATDIWNWRAIFVVTGIGAGLMLLLCFTTLPETNARTDRGGFAEMANGMRDVAGNLLFWGYALQAGFSIALFYSFLASAPYLMVDVLNRPARDYGLWFPMVTGVFILGNYCSSRLLTRYSIDFVIRRSVIAIWLVVLSMIPLYYYLPLTPALLFLPVTVVSLLQGFVIANSQAGAMSAAPHVAGAASGLATFLQIAIGAAAVQVVGMLNDQTPWPMVGSMVIMATIAVLILPLMRALPAAGAERKHAE